MNSPSTQAETKALLGTRRLATGALLLGMFQSLFGLFSVIGAVGYWAPRNFPDEALQRLEQDEPEQLPVLIALREMEDSTLWGLSIASVVIGLALLVSGVGIWKRHLGLGRLLGSIAAMGSLAFTLVGPLFMPDVVREAGGGLFTPGLLGKLVFPLLTLWLLNGTLRPYFRSDPEAV